MADTDPAVTIGFIGDALTARGYRLAGVEVETAQDPDAVAQALERMRKRCDIVLVSADSASKLPSKLRASVLAATHPLMLIVPDAHDRVELPDLGRAWKQQLGVES